MTTIFEPERQTQWGWAATVNFFSGGAGAGYYLIVYLYTSFISTELAPQPMLPPAVLTLILMSAGIFCVAMESGRPLQGYRTILGLIHSWMSREIFCFVLFACFTFGDLLTSSKWLEIVLAIIALMFIACQAMVVRVSSAIQSWQSPLVVVLIMSNALVSGFGVSLCAEFGQFFTQYMSSMAFGMGLIICSSLSWFMHLYRNVPSSINHSVKGRNMLQLKHGVGRMVPLVLLVLLALLPKQDLQSDYYKIALVIIGLTLLFGSYALTHWLLHSTGMKRAVRFE